MTMTQEAEFLANPKPAPALNIPSSTATVRVQIIDSTSTLTVPVAAFMHPPIHGHSSLQGPAFSFLITHPISNTRILFDLGTRRDWHNFAPAVVKLLSQPGWDVQVEKDVATILIEHGVDVAGGAIDSIVWSHWHYDHIGDPSTFPGTTDLVVGPGFKEALFPAWPTNPDGVVRENDFEGRELREVSFEGTKRVGGFGSFDYFGDGSFYLLDTPGHAVGHMCGLARVSTGPGKEDTFIFMGADACHHGGEFRPTEYLPIPKAIAPSPLKHYVSAGFCPGSLFMKLHHKHSVTEPFYRVKEGLSYDLDKTQLTVEHLKEFDAAENVFVVIAHDATLLEPEVGITWFPEGDMNDWRDKDTAKKARWGFLKSFEEATAASNQ